MITIYPKLSLRRHSLKSQARGFCNLYDKIQLFIDGGRRQLEP